MSTRMMGEEGVERARETMRGMSIRRRVGFVGDSIQISYDRY